MVNLEEVPARLKKGRIGEETGMKITAIRRVVQVLTFVLLIYAGLLGIGQKEISWLPSIQSPEHMRQQDWMPLLQGPGYAQVFNTYLPIRSCRFARSKGMFRACSLHFLSESLSWLTPLRDFLPHLLLLLLLAFLFGRFWCGWVCPLGTLSDFFSVIRRRLRIARIKLPRIFQEVLVNFKYVLLGFILLISLIVTLPYLSWPLRKALYLSSCQLCPSRFIFPYIAGFPFLPTLDSPILVSFFAISLFFFLIFLSSFFFSRAYCRLCPIGALLSFFNRGGGISKEKDVLRCTHCGICATACPVENTNVYTEKERQDINSPCCIRCLRCVELCPEEGALTVKFFGRSIFKSQAKWK